jgi:hypothetical protein
MERPTEAALARRRPAGPGAAWVGRGRPAGGADDDAAPGQVHHDISQKVYQALQRHRRLRGRYRLRDRRFAARARDRSSHCGYQQWHRRLDGQTVDWIEGNPDARPAQFEAFLRGRYAQADLHRRFPRRV